MRRGSAAVVEGGRCPRRPAHPEEAWGYGSRRIPLPSIADLLGQSGRLVELAR